jgi:hypothetical protein
MDKYFDEGYDPSVDFSDADDNVLVSRIFSLA